MAVHLLQVTIGAGTRTQVSATAIQARQAMFQNNGSNAMRLGDSTTTTTKGANLVASGGTLNSGPLMVQQVDLSQWYVAGTQNDVLDVIYID